MCFIKLHIIWLVSDPTLTITGFFFWIINSVWLILDHPLLLNWKIFEISAQKKSKDLVSWFWKWHNCVQYHFCSIYQFCNLIIIKKLSEQCTVWCLGWELSNFSSIMWREEMIFWLLLLSYYISWTSPLSGL